MRLDSSMSAVVTGGASGLGEATARSLSGVGVGVTIFDTNDARGQAVAKEIGASYVSVDVTSDESVEKGFAMARAINGQERILVNCAGILLAAKTVSRSRETGSLVPFPVRSFEKVIQVNLIGTFRCVVASALGMVSLAPEADGERGVIINTASVAATDGQIGQAAYSASKGGVMSLALPVARDLAAEGIRINTIMPGIMQTAMMDGAPANVREGLAASVLFPKRLGKPTEYASLVIEILRNGYLNGESIRLDGGIRMAPR